MKLNLCGAEARSLRAQGTGLGGDAQVPVAGLAHPVATGFRFCFQHREDGSACRPFIRFAASDARGFIDFGARCAGRKSSLLVGVLPLVSFVIKEIAVFFNNDVLGRPVTKKSLLMGLWRMPYGRALVYGRHGCAY